MSELIVIHSTNFVDNNFNDGLTDVLDEVGQDLGIEQTAINYEEATSRIQQIQKAHAVIISGVPFIYPLETAEDLQPYLRGWIQEIDIPVLGICLGHQALGLAFGATMRRDEEVEHGLTRAKIKKEHQSDPIFNGLGRSFEIASLHWASIAINEASSLKLLASSGPKVGVSETGCESQIIRVCDKQIYGTQFHPEHTNEGKKLLRNFLRLV